MKHFLTSLFLVSAVYASVIQPLQYPQVTKVTYFDGVIIEVTDPTYNSCGTSGCIFQDYPRFDTWKNTLNSMPYTRWIYRAVIDSIYHPQDASLYPTLYFKIDSCLFGGDEYLGHKDSITIKGSRDMNTYPKDYWSSFKGKKVLAQSAYDSNRGIRYPAVSPAIKTDAWDFDDFTYFSNADTIWNDQKGYGIPIALSPIIAQLRIDSAVAANTVPNLPNPTPSTDVELWSLEGEKLWTGRNWKESGLPAGAYLLRNPAGSHMVGLE